jgi:predicted nucleic acid-binding protein
MHLAIAKEAGCTKLATFDRDFDETRAELQPILLQRDSF